MLIATKKGIVEKLADTCIAITPGAVKPFENLVGIVPQGIDLRDLVPGFVGLVIDQFLKRRIGSRSVAADLLRQGERDILPAAGLNFLLGCAKRGLSITTLDRDDGKLGIEVSMLGLQFDGFADRLLGLVKTAQRATGKRKPVITACA